MKWYWKWCGQECPYGPGVGGALFGLSAVVIGFFLAPAIAWLFYFIMPLYQNLWPTW